MGGSRCLQHTPLAPLAVLLGFVAGFAPDAGEDVAGRLPAVLIALLKLVDDVGRRPAGVVSRFAAAGGEPIRRRETSLLAGGWLSGGTPGSAFLVAVSALGRGTARHRGLPGLGSDLVLPSWGVCGSESLLGGTP